MTTMPNIITPVGKTRAWTKWLLVSLFSDRPIGAGQYMLRATRNSCPITIARTLQSDSDGILYIGETKSLQTRFILLVRSFQTPYKRTKHSAAIKYFACAQHQIDYPLGGLEVRYRLNELPPLTTARPVQAWPDVGGKDRAIVGERAELHNYEAKFGDLPILNSIRGKRLR